MPKRLGATDLIGDTSYMKNLQFEAEEKYVHVDVCHSDLDTCTLN